MHDGAMPDGAMILAGLAGELVEARLDGFNADGVPCIARPGAVGTEEARSILPLGPGDVGTPLLVGRLGPLGTPVVLGRLIPPRRVEADGEVRSIEATDRLELRCGPASLTLFADGRVEVRGTQILSRSEGSHRIQGATVLLN